MRYWIVNILIPLDAFIWGLLISISTCRSGVTTRKMLARVTPQRGLGNPEKSRGRRTQNVRMQRDTLPDHTLTPPRSVSEV